MFGAMNKPLRQLRLYLYFEFNAVFRMSLYDLCRRYCRPNLFKALRAFGDDHNSERPSTFL